MIGNIYWRSCPGVLRPQKWTRLIVVKIWMVASYGIVVHLLWDSLKHYHYDLNDTICRVCWALCLYKTWDQTDAFVRLWKERTMPSTLMFCSDLFWTKHQTDAFVHILVCFWLLNLLCKHQTNFSFGNRHAPNWEEREHMQIATERWDSNPLCLYISAFLAVGSHDSTVKFTLSERYRKIWV